MKCFQGNQRGIAISANTVASIQAPVLFAESLLKSATSRFGDRLVFADFEKRGEKVVLTAQADDDDKRAMVFYHFDHGTTEESNDKLEHATSLRSAQMLHSEVTDHYHGLGLTSQTRRVLLAIEPGGSAVLSMTRTVTHWPGLIGSLLGGREWSEDITSAVRLSYDGEQVTVENLPVERKQLEYFTLSPSREIHLR